MTTRSESAARAGRSTYTFVDLFSGLGGFHVGLSRLGHRCVFACEIDRWLQAAYAENFGMVPAGDIRRIDVDDIPPHDILCSGFPCQPFSLAGKKTGAKCPSSGKLIDDVFRIVDWHQPKYVFLENVPNVLTIAGGSFWAHICMSFHALGYVVEHRIYSPTQFGLPQQRQRLFIVARRRSQPAFQWPEPKTPRVRPLSEFIRVKDGLRRLEAEKRDVIEKWNEVVSFLRELSSHTLIASEFGAT
ncbi:MAG: DNA cytosine methyltransferase [Dokdonella sp.]|uniref:DNA cytosine methyltransferase n=1 Tax=Dokdonella sp. TaxID=2291710 RepID=UPI003F80E5A0